ncbi:MAG: type VI secretion system protein ImpJ [Phenylobacterium sp.]|jgi:type VI secretion system protein ImpJ
MSAKVIWSEGSFIRPQHFQQHERFVLQQLDNRTRDQFPFGYGFSQLALNVQDLEFGRVTLTTCCGFFQDGTTFNAPEYDKLLPSIDVDNSIKDAIVYLAIPTKNAATVEVAEHSDTDETGSLTRYIREEATVVDLSTSQLKTADLQLGKLRLRLFVEAQNGNDDSQRVPQGYLKLAVAHISEIRSGRIKLNDAFIPTIINFSQSTVLLDFIHHLHSILTTRADELAARASSSGGKGGVAEVSDFMLLQMINRFEPLFGHYGVIEGLHPLFLYQTLISFAGEMSTFMKQNKRPMVFPEYNHDAAIKSFLPIIQDIKKSFDVILAQHAQSIPLSPPKNGFRAARITNPAILDTAYFVLAISAQVPDERIRTEFPAQVKIAPGEQIYRLVHSALPGIEIVPMPAAPREIPLTAGFTYFELNQQNPLWQELKTSQGMAFHVSGEFPGLEMQLWSINRR